MTNTLFVMDPVAPHGMAAQPTRRVLSSLKETVVGFVDNSKPNFDFLAEEIGRVLMSEHGVKAVEMRRKRVASIAVSDEFMTELADRCDVVITGSGD